MRGLRDVNAERNVAADTVSSPIPRGLKKLDLTVPRTTRLRCLPLRDCTENRSPTDSLRSLAKSSITMAPSRPSELATASSPFFQSNRKPLAIVAGSTPETATWLPATLAWSCTTLVTEVTPGTAATCAGILVAIGDQPSAPATTYCALTDVCTDPVVVSLRPEPRTATKVTSAMPIISAAAVDAVRPGLRMALRRASMPADLPIRAPGRPMAEANGVTKRGDRAATPANSARQPGTSESRRSVADRPLPNIP